MFTLFHLLELVGVAVGLSMGGVIGHAESGWGGAIGGALLGAPVGWLLGRVPYFIGRLLLHLTLRRETADELRARLRIEIMWPLYQLVMEELQRRGEDVRSELPLVLTLLSAAGVAERHRGWQMLRFFFPDLAAKIPGYDPSQTAAHCRAQTESIRSL